MIKFLWRLSVILLIPTIIFTLIVYRPIRYLINGNYYPKITKTTILSKWINKVL